MKTKLLYAAMFFSPAVFGQDASVKTNQAIDVKTEAKISTAASANVNTSVNSANTIQATQSAAHSATQTAADVQAKTAASVKQSKAEATVQTKQALTSVKRVPDAAISTDMQSSTGISAGKNNKLNVATSLNNTTSAVAQPVKVSSVQNQDLAVKTGKVHASTVSVVKNTAVVKPKTLKVKTAMKSTNSTLLKIK